MENIMEEKNNIEEPIIETKKTFSLKHEIFEWIYTIFIAIVIAFVIKTFIFDIVQVDGASMFPTLVDGDRLIVQKIGYSPKVGDIVILDSSYKNREAYYDDLEEQTGKESGIIEKGMKYLSLPDNLKIKYYVKRVIAKEGQVVDLRDGKVYVDNEPLNEDAYYDGVTTIMDPTCEFPQTVQEGCIFVMGDNRPHSLDSRTSSLGQVPVKAVAGAARFRLWPLNKMGTTK